MYCPKYSILSLILPQNLRGHSSCHAPLSLIVNLSALGILKISSKQNRRSYTTVPLPLIPSISPYFLAFHLLFANTLTGPHQTVRIIGVLLHTGMTAFVPIHIFRANQNHLSTLFQLLQYHHNIWLRWSKFNTTFQHSHNFSCFSLNLSGSMLAGQHQMISCIRNALSRLSSNISRYLYPQNNNNAVCSPPYFL